MSMVQEFKAFAMRGTVVDMAVGVVVGGAFGKIVTSFVNDVLMPPIGLMLGGVNFSGMKLTLKAAVGEAAAVTLNLGSFLQTIVDFLIVAFAIFLVVKAMNATKKKQEAEQAAPPADIQLLTQIRDALTKR